MKKTNEKFFNYYKQEKIFDKHINSQNNLKNTISNLMQDFVDFSENSNLYSTEHSVKFIEDLNSILKLCDDTTLSLKNLKEDLNQFMDTPTKEKKAKHMKEKDIPDDIKCSETKSNNDVIQNSNLDIILLENTLIISELKGNVILPFKKKDLECILEKNPNKYKSIYDIVNSIYTIPLYLFKNTPIARFREAFKLMRNKEKNSIKDAIDLGVELMFNYNLHPAIITACKNIDELDIYLDYLDSGEPQKFDCFKIVFEFPPVIVKKQK